MKAYKIVFSLFFVQAVALARLLADVGANASTEPSGQTNLAGYHIAGTGRGNVGSTFKPNPSRTGGKSKTDEGTPPPFVPWEIFWTDYQGGLIESRSSSQIKTPGEMNLVVDLPNELSASQPIVTVPKQTVPLRELNVVFRQSERNQRLTLRGGFTNAIIGTIVRDRDPKTIRSLYNQENLVAGAVILRGNVAPQRVNVITELGDLRDRRTFRR